MAKSVFQGISIRGIAGAVPRGKVRNLVDHEFCPEAERGQIVGLTGVSEYRKASPEICTSDLCEAAARELMSTLEILPAEIDAVLFATMTPDFRVPSTSCILQSRLGCNVSTVTYDINMGCSGFIVGLYNACALIRGAGLQRVLLLAGDTQTKLCYERDKNVVFLLGDAGTATLVETCDRGEDIRIELFTDGSRFDKLYVPAGGCRKPSSDLTRQIVQAPDGGVRSEDNLYMDGMEIFKFSSTEVVKSIKDFMDVEHLSVDDIDFLLLHQANKFMTDKIARKLKFPPEKVPYSLQVYGNTAAASIPLTIAHNFPSMSANARRRCLLSGFGVGLSWGTALVALGDLTCPPIVEC